ncbi:MAG: hypothetical protein IT204_07730 [Fimbriimonadaceae bacterium]|nr:hypothetical protein [Fimbriimonadaceae bacterium]
MRATAWRWLLGLGLLTLPAGAAVEVVLVLLDPTSAVVMSREPVTLAPRAVLAWDDSPGRVVVDHCSGREVVLRLPAGPPAGWQVGRPLALRLTTDEPPQPLNKALPVPQWTGTVTRIEQGAATAMLPTAADQQQAAAVVREGQRVGQVQLVPGTGREWRAEATGGELALRLGDRISYRGGTASAVISDRPPPPATTPPPRRPHPAPQERVLSGDHPFYDTFATLAAHGFFPGTGRRQFDGESQAIYTRGQLADILAGGVRRLLDRDRDWPAHHLSAAQNGALAGLVQEFREDLAARGIDLPALQRRLSDLPQTNAPWWVTGFAEGRLGGGDDATTGRAEVAVQGRFGSRLRWNLTGSTEGSDALPDDRDRSYLAGYQLDYDLSRHFGLSFARQPLRQGFGRNDLLASDRAQPLDHLAYRYHTKFWGRPFRYEHAVGLFKVTGGERYLALQRYEYQPNRRLSLGLGFGLITDRGSQAVAGFLPLPLYAVRFTAGAARVGGSGNFLGAFDASYRFNEGVALYGQVFADEFDFSPAPPTTRQRIGFLGGLHLTPAGRLPGTSYRLEVALIPDQGTYVGQMDVGLAWLRDGVLLGHPYGQDSVGVRLDGHQRLTGRADLNVLLEYYRQLRSSPVQPETTRVEVVGRYDLTPNFTLGVGARYRQRLNQGGVVANDRSETSVFLEARGGF